MGEAKKKAMKESKYQPGDAAMVVRSADAFRAFSRPFCERVASLGRREAIEEGRRSMGEMIASATNLAFAVELYMKALRIVRGQGPRWTHNIAKLYSEFPKELQESIEAAYEAAPRPNVVKHVIDLGISITHKYASEEDRIPKPLGPNDQSIRAVLERSSDAFEVWRYLYDQGEPGKVKRLPYEFHYLGVAAEALREHVERGLREHEAQLSAK